MDSIKTASGKTFDVSLVVSREYPAFLYAYIENSTLSEIADAFGDGEETKEITHGNVIYKNFVLRSITAEGKAFMVQFAK